MKNNNKIIEIGSGEDYSIDWDARFKFLKDIDIIINDYESVGKELKNNELVRILNELRKLESSVPSVQNFNSAFDLIEGCVWVDQEYYDPDMPTSSYWKKITTKESLIPSIVALINRAYDLFKELHEKDGIPQLIDELHKDIEYKKTQKEKELAQRTVKEFKSKVSELLSEIEKVFEQKTGLYHLHPYLINLDDGVVLVLTVHTSYRNTRSDLEKSVTSILATKHIVFEIEESSPSGSGHIPHWAGNKRFREMGWEQNKSVLSHPDEDVLKVANQLRDKHVTTILERSTSTKTGFTL